MQPVPEFNMALFLPNDSVFEQSLNQALTSSSNQGGVVASDLKRTIGNGVQTIVVNDERIRAINHLCQIACEALSTFEMECFEESCARELDPIEQAQVETYQQSIRERLTEIAEIRKEYALSERNMNQTEMDHQVAFHQNVMNHQFDIGMRSLEAMRTEIQLIYEMQIRQVEYAAAEHDLQLRVQEEAFNQWLLQNEQESLEKEQSATHRLEAIKIEHQRILEMKKQTGLENDTDLIRLEMDLSHQTQEARLELENVKVEAETRRRVAAAHRKSSRKSTCNIF